MSVCMAVYVHVHVNLCSFRAFEMQVSVRTRCKDSSFQNQGEQPKLSVKMTAGPQQSPSQVSDHKLDFVSGSNSTLGDTVFIF